MANPLKGEALVKVDAGEFTLAFTLGTAVTIQRDFDGKPITEVISAMQQNHDIEALLTVLWACLKKHHNLSKDEVADVVTLQEISVWSEALAAAMSDPDAKEGAARPPKAKTDR